MAKVWSGALVVLLFAAVAASGGEPRTDFLGDPLPARALVRLGTTRLQHGGQIRGVAVSDDGKLLASVGGDKAVCVWDARDGKLVRKFRVAHWGPWALTFSRNGKELAAVESSPNRGGKDALRRWDLETGRLLQGDKDSPPTFDSIVRHVALACPAEGGFVAAETSGPEIALYRPGDPRPAKILKGQGGRVMSVAFTRDGRTLVSLADDGVVRFWRVRDGGEVARLPALTVTKYGLKGNLAAVAVSADEKTVAVSLPDGSTRLLDAAGRELRRLPSAEQMDSLAFSPDGKALLTGRTVLQKWDVATGAEIPILRQPGHPVRSLALSPDGKTVAFADDHENLRLADVATGKTLVDRKIPCRAGVAFAPDGKQLATAAGDQTIALRDVTKLHGEPAAVLRCLGKVRTFALAPDGKHLATAEGGLARVYEIATQRAVWTVQPLGHTVFAVAYSPDGKLLAMMGEQHLRLGIEDGMLSQVVRLWDTATGTEVPVGVEVYRTAHTLAFHPNGKAFAAIHLPEAAKAIPRGIDGGPMPAPDDRLETVRLWDVAFARERLRFVDPLRRKLAETATAWISGRSSSQAVAFAPDGRVFAAPGATGIVLYETLAGQPRLRLEGHLQEVTGLAFTPDGKTLVSASGDGTVLIWDVTGLRTGGKLPGGAGQLWNALADADAERAGRAVWAMVDQPAESLAVLRPRLKPAGPDAMSKLIDQLDHPRYAVRQQATRQLEGLGRAAEEALMNKLKAGPSLEMTRRIENLLKSIKTVPLGAEVFQTLRGVEVLERIGTPAARDHLRALADGTAGAWVTVQAREALERLNRHKQ